MRTNPAGAFVTPIVRPNARGIIPVYSAGVPPQSDREIVAKLRAVLLDTLEDAAGAVRSSRRAISFAQGYVKQRERLDQTRQFLHSTVDVHDHELVLREASLRYLNQLQRVTDAPSPSALERTWVGFLIEAAEKVERDRRDVQAYARLSREADDEDREWSDAAARIAGEHWQRTN